jgi:hypothetical protein
MLARDLQTRELAGVVFKNATRVEARVSDKNFMLMKERALPTYVLGQASFIGVGCVAGGVCNSRSGMLAMFCPKNNTYSVPEE